MPDYQITIYATLPNDEAAQRVCLSAAKRLRETGGSSNSFGIGRMTSQDGKDRWGGGDIDLNDEICAVLGWEPRLKLAEKA